MEPVTSSVQQFLMRWLAHLSERSVRLHYYLAQLAVKAPRSSGKPPSVIAGMVADVEAFAEAVRRGGRLLSERPLSRGEIVVAYQGCITFVRQFLKLHARLSHLPKDWVRSEVELFLNSIGASVNHHALELLQGNKKLLESYSVVTTSIYNFANLLDDRGHPGRGVDDSEALGAARDLLAIPAVEQHNTLFWPILVHELAHSIYDASEIGRDPAISEFVRRDVGSELQDRGDNLAGWWLEEMFCDLFAAAVTGPIYQISLTMFALFWVPDVIKLPASTHPSPDVRLRYISAFLKRTNPDFMSAIEPELRALSSYRLELDFLCDPDSVQGIHKSIQGGDIPKDEKLLQLAQLIAQSETFRTITQPCYTANLLSIRKLQDRAARGEFIGTSRRSSELPKPTIEAVSSRFDEYTRDLAERPNPILDILTATACYQTRFLLDKTQYDQVRGSEKTPHFPTIYVRDFLCGNTKMNEFLTRATEFIHAADATAIKSLEGSELARFYLDEP